jgi:hypothetical protein
VTTVRPARGKEITARDAEILALIGRAPDQGADRRGPLHLGADGGEPRGCPTAQVPGDGPAQLGTPRRAASAPARGGLPVPVTALLGRVAERADLSDSLAAHRLVTAIGPGEGQQRQHHQCQPAQRGRSGPLWTHRGPDFRKSSTAMAASKTSPWCPVRCEDPGGSHRRTSAAPLWAPATTKVPRCGTVNTKPSVCSWATARRTVPRARPNWPHRLLSDGIRCWQWSWPALGSSGPDRHDGCPLTRRGYSSRNEVRP